jgi:trans-aconitate methyltransferase
MPFGDKWRHHGADYWDAMAERCADLPMNELLAAEVVSRKSVIEIGCGAGHLARMLIAAGFSGRYWGCDISRAAVLAAQQRLGAAATFEAGQFEVLSAAHRVPSAEVVVARSVIQHQKHWFPMVATALRHAPRVVLGISRSIYFKESGEHEVTDRGSWFDVRISLEAMDREANDAALSCSFTRAEGSRGPEVVIAITSK